MYKYVSHQKQNIPNSSQNHKNDSELTAFVIFCLNAEIFSMSKVTTMLAVCLPCSDEYKNHIPCDGFLMAIRTLCFMLGPTHPTISLELNQQPYVVTHSCTTISQPLDILSITLLFYILLQLTIIILHIFTSIVVLISIIIQFTVMVLNIYYFLQNILISSNNKLNTDYNSNTTFYYYLYSVGMNKIIFCLIHNVLYYYIGIKQICLTKLNVIIILINIYWIILKFMLY